MEQMVTALRHVRRRWNWPGIQRSYGVLNAVYWETQRGKPWTIYNKENKAPSEKWIGIPASESTMSWRCMIIESRRELCIGSKIIKKCDGSRDRWSINVLALSWRIRPGKSQGDVFLTDRPARFIYINVDWVPAQICPHAWNLPRSDTWTSETGTTDAL